MNKIMEEIQKLSIEEQMQIAYAIWENANFGDHEIVLSPEVKAMLDERLEAARLTPGEGYTWEEVKAKVQSRLK